MATKKTQIDVVGIIANELGKSIKTESKSLFGACKVFLQLLQENGTKGAKDALAKIKSVTKSRYNDEKKESIVKSLAELCKTSAQYQSNGTMCAKFEKKHSASVEGVTIVTPLFKGFKEKETFSIGFIIECWNRYLKDTPSTDVTSQFMTNDQILIKYVEVCKEKGLEVSEQKLLAYDMIKNGDAILAEAV